MDSIKIYDRYPAIVLKPNRMTAPFLKPMGQTGPRTFDGRSQDCAPDAGYWTMAFSVDLFHEAEILEWRGFITARQGRLNPFVMGLFDDRHAPQIAGLPNRTSGIPYSDGALHSDGSGFSQSNVVVELLTDMAEGATTASFKVTSSGPLQRGMYFSIENRLAMISRVPNVVSATQVDVVFLPPARKAQPAGTAVELAQPTVLMKLSDPASGAMEVRPPYTAEASLSLEESFDGLL